MHTFVVLISPSYNVSLWSGRPFEELFSSALADAVRATNKDGHDIVQLLALLIGFANALYLHHLEIRTEIEKFGFGHLTWKGKPTISMAERASVVTVRCFAWLPRASTLKFWMSAGKETKWLRKASVSAEREPGMAPTP